LSPSSWEKLRPADQAAGRPPRSRRGSLSAAPRRAGPTNGSSSSRRARPRSIASISSTPRSMTRRGPRARCARGRGETRDAAISSGNLGHAGAGQPVAQRRRPQALGRGFRLRSASLIEERGDPGGEQADRVEHRRSAAASTRRRRRSRAGAAGRSAAGPSQLRSSIRRTMVAGEPPQLVVAGGSGSRRRASRSVVSASRPRLLGQATLAEQLDAAGRLETAPSVTSNRRRAAGSCSSATTSHSSRTSAGWLAVGRRGRRRRSGRAAHESR